MADIGHNSANEKLSSYISRIERLMEEKKAIQTDISEIFKEAKSEGFDAPTMRQIIKERAMDEADRREREELLETYRNALGGLVDSPLGEAALRAAQ